MIGAGSIHKDSILCDAVWRFRNVSTTGGTDFMGSRYFPNCHGLQITEIGMFCRAATGGVQGASFLLNAAINPSDTMEMDGGGMGWVTAIDGRKAGGGTVHFRYHPYDLSTFTIGELNVKAAGEHFCFRPDFPFIIIPSAKDLVDTRQPGIALAAHAAENLVTEAYTVDWWARYRVLRGQDGIL